MIVEHNTFLEHERILRLLIITRDIRAYFITMNIVPINCTADTIFITCVVVEITRTFVMIKTKCINVDVGHVPLLPKYVFILKCLKQNLCQFIQYFMRPTHQLF